MVGCSSVVAGSTARSEDAAASGEVVGSTDGSADGSIEGATSIAGEPDGSTAAAGAANRPPIMTAAAIRATKREGRERAEAGRRPDRVTTVLSNGAQAAPGVTSWRGGRDSIPRSHPPQGLETGSP